MLCFQKGIPRAFRAGILLGVLPVVTLRAGSIPYQGALDAAAVNLADLSNISTKGLVIGNGELNAIVYTSGNDIRLRVSKNDCWDMRITTAADPAMPTVNPATSTFTGTNGSSPASWNNYVYPTGLPCAEVTLAAVTGQTGWGASTLDLTKALATVVSNADTTRIRILAQRNVFYINSSRTISFTGINQIVKTNGGASISGWVNNITTGTQGGYVYMCQTIPGDADVAGMSIYLVTGGSGSTQVIAVVTSRDSATPLDDAVALVQTTLNDANSTADHETVWDAFWSKSGVQLDDAVLQRWWYRMLYYNRCFAASGANAVGLKAGFDALGGWHNSLKVNYNTQQTYFSGGPVNHPEFIEPLIDALTRNLNRAKWFASTNFIGCSGAFYHSDLWPFEPDPANCTTTNKHQLAYLPWGYTWGAQGHLIFNLWEYYQYNPGSASLAKVYPVLSQLGTFLCSSVELCPSLNGKWKIGPSFFPENGNYGQYNTAYDIAFISSGLKATQAAATLYGDTTLATRCATVLAKMPTYSTVVDTNQSSQTVVEEWQGSGLQGSDRHGSQTQPIFPAGEITWFSSQADKDLFTRTVTREETITTHANSNVMLNVSRARLSLSDAISNAKTCFATYSPEQPNGLFYWNAHGYYISEQFGISRLVTEYLLQSVGGVIRIFPAWSSAMDAHFTNLLAIGGFQVSADQAMSRISNVKISSTVGGNVSLVNPWATTAISVVDQATGSSVNLSTNNNISTFSTTAGATYLVMPAGTPAAPTGLSATVGNTTARLSWAVSSGASSCNLKRATISGGPYATVLSSTLGNSYVDTGLTNGTAYYYVVTALLGQVESPVSTEVSVTPSSSTTPVSRVSGGTASASAENPPNETSSKAFDGTTSTKWYNAVNGGTGWLQYQFASGIAWTISEYKVSSANDVSQRDPKNWQFQGSNDGSTWTTLDTQTNQTFASRLLTKTYDFTNTTPYHYYRLNITANSGGSGYGLQLSELALLSSPSDAGDKTSPVLTLPANIVTDATLANGTPVSFSATATDAVSGAVTPVSLPATGTVFPIGTTTVQCSATDIVGNRVSGSFTVTVRSTFTAFQQLYFTTAQQADSSISGPSADPDEDGIPNLLEYATSTSPLQADSTAATLGLGAGNAALTLTFQRLSPAPVTYTVEASTNLSTWTTLCTLAQGSDTWSGTATASETTSGGTRAVTVTDVATVSTNGSRFLRLRVSP
ncbi:MAG: discoidin domain-containing protein [Verrucomicrobia bacterium]|nr:discoidin domain-containing protein [Verrucomicrobiota bacterium]